MNRRVFCLESKFVRLNAHLPRGRCHLPTVILQTINLIPICVSRVRLNARDLFVRLNAHQPFVRLNAPCRFSPRAFAFSNGTRYDSMPYCIKNISRHLKNDLRHGILINDCAITILGEFPSNDMDMNIPTYLAPMKNRLRQGYANKRDSLRKAHSHYYVDGGSSPLPVTILSVVRASVYRRGTESFPFRRLNHADH